METTSAPPITPAQRKWILAALMATMMLAAMDSTIVSTAIPQIVGDLGGFSLFTWVFSIYVLAQTVMIPIYGKLADEYGRKPILVVGTLIFLLGSAASAASWNMVSLIVFRGLQGLGAGSIMATVNTLAGDLFNIRERGRVQGWLSSVWGFSAIAGPTLGGAFAQYIDWRWIFLVNLPVGAVALALIIRFVHETVEQRQHRVDYAGSVLVLLTVGTLIFGLLQGGSVWPWISWESGLLLVLVVAFAAATWWVERRAAEPILPGWLWSRRVLAGSNLAMVGMGIVMMGPISYLPTFAQSVYGLGAILAGFVLAVMSFGWPLASSQSSRIYLRFGFRDCALAGAVLMIAASAGFLLLPWQGSIWWVVFDQFCFGAGFGLLSTPLLVGVQSVVGWRQRGQVTGANMFSRFLGQSLGAAIFGALFNASLRDQLAAAPASLAGLSQDINQLVGKLQSPDLGATAGDFLRHAVFASTQHIYWGIGAFSVFTLLCVYLTPKHFPIIEEEPAA